MMKTSKQKYLWQLAGLISLDLALFGFTNAAQVPSWLLIAGLLAMAGTIYQISYGIFSLASLYGIVIKRKRWMAAQLTCLLSGLVAWQSLGELGVLDFAVLLPLVAVGYLYSFYRAGDKPKLAT